MIDLDELMRMHAAATPGPWSVKIVDFEAEDGYGTVSASYVNADGKMICVPFDRGPDDENDESDAAYIVAACNAVPELVSRIRELERLCEQQQHRLDFKSRLIEELINRNMISGNNGSGRMNYASR